jgi:hypothetical protein
VIVERLGWCLPAECLAWSAVECGGDGVEFARRDESCGVRGSYRRTVTEEDF